MLPPPRAKVYCSRMLRTWFYCVRCHVPASCRVRAPEDLNMILLCSPPRACVSIVLECCEHGSIVLADMCHRLYCSCLSHVPGASEFQTWPVDIFGMSTTRCSLNFAGIKNLNSTLPYSGAVYRRTGSNQARIMAASRKDGRSLENRWLIIVHSNSRHSKIVNYLLFDLSKEKMREKIFALQPLTLKLCHVYIHILEL